MNLSLEELLDLADRVEKMPGKTVEGRLWKFLVLELEGFCAGIREDDEYSQGYKRALLRVKEVLEGDEVY